MQVLSLKILQEQGRPNNTSLLRVQPALFCKSGLFWLQLHPESWTCTLPPQHLCILTPPALVSPDMYQEFWHLD